MGTRDSEPKAWLGYVLVPLLLLVHWVSWGSERDAYRFMYFPSRSCSTYQLAAKDGCPMMGYWSSGTGGEMSSRTLKMDAALMSEDEWLIQAGTCNR